MTHRNTLKALVGLFGCVLLTGCMPKMTIKEMKAMMPKRPVELDHLEMFMGDWTFEGEVTMSGLDEVLETSGTNSARWEGNKWYMVSDGIFKMGDFDEMKGMETWTYDTASKCFRNTWVDSMGSLGVGKGWYNADEKRWKMKSTSHSPFGTTSMKATVTFPDDDTMEWSMTETAMWGLITTMEMKGTSKRK